MNEVKYKEAVYDDVSSISDNLVLIVTATETETKATHEKLSPLPGQEALLKIFHGTLTYYIGIFGNYGIVHVQCGMGSLSRSSSIMTLNEAIGLFKPKVVIMVGIAFGIDSQKQSIGDVLLAEGVLPYNFKRVGQESTIYRGLGCTTSKLLFSRFKSVETWQFLLPDNSRAKLLPGQILSGEELIDNLERRDELKKAFSNAIGGEMEGAGVYAACDGNAHWIIVKGICDFADGEKGKNKNQNQQIAIESALSLCLEVFSSYSAFKELNITPFDPQLYSKIDTELANKLLFDIYDIEKEGFYIKRKIDDEFVNTINYFGLWVYGSSGYGKSNYILRNLIFNEFEFVQISLGGCIGVTVESFFVEILFELASKTEGVDSQIQPNTFADSNKYILQLLSKYYKNKKLILFIEEIPITGESEYREFAQKIFTLIGSKNLYDGLANVRFILSSINSPIPHIGEYQQKIHESLKFVELDAWTKDEIIPLINIIAMTLRIPLPEGILDKIIVNSKMSPRFTKKFFRNVLTIGKFELHDLTYAIEETKRELNY